MAQPPSKIVIGAPALVNRLEIIDANQYELDQFSKGPVKVMHLCTVGKGSRTFIYLSFINEITGAIVYYLNEFTTGQPEVIEDDGEYAEIAWFIDKYGRKIKGAD